MKKTGLQNAELAALIAALGHTQTIVIADVGLPVPEDVPCIDLAVVAGIPSFLDVLRAVLGEGVFESGVIASEITAKNSDMKDDIRVRVNGMPLTEVPHEEFKELTKNARCIVRTGETSPYANIILVGGVNF